MYAVRFAIGKPVAPFGDLPGDLPVLGRPLREVQEEALKKAGVTLGQAPSQGPYLLIGDNLWLTAPLIRRFLQTVSHTEGGQLALGGDFVRHTRALQELEGNTPRYPLALLPGGPPDPARLAALPAVEVDIDARPVEAGFTHPLLAQAAGGPYAMSDAVAHTLSHWSHLMRLNVLGIAAHADGARRAWEASPWWRKALKALAVLLKARSIDPHHIAGALTERGARCRIHPTAVVEASILGDDVEIGPFAVVRASILRDGARVGEHCRVNLSTLGRGAQLSRGATLNLCVVMERAFVSQGNGFQACVFGEDSFTAWGATAFDLTMGRDIEVWHEGERVSSGLRFLGSAIGHRALVMPHVILGYGEEVANDAQLLADPAFVARKIPQGLSAGTPYVIRNGRVVPLKAKE